MLRVDSPSDSFPLQTMETQMAVDTDITRITHSIQSSNDPTQFSLSVIVIVIVNANDSATVEPMGRP